MARRPLGSARDLFRFFRICSAWGAVAQPMTRRAFAPHRPMRAPPNSRRPAPTGARDGVLQSTLATLSPIRTMLRSGEGILFLGCPSLHLERRLHACSSSSDDSDSNITRARRHARGGSTFWIPLLAVASPTVLLVAFGAATFGAATSATPKSKAGHPKLDAPFLRKLAFPQTWIPLLCRSYSNSITLRPEFGQLHRSSEIAAGRRACADQVINVVARHDPRRTGNQKNWLPLFAVHSTTLTRHSACASGRTRRSTSEYSGAGRSISEYSGAGVLGLHQPSGRPQGSS